MKKLIADPIYPKTIGTADLFQGASSPNTWYTVIDITGKGVLYRSSGYIASVNSSYLELKITVDGTSYTWDSTSAIFSRSFAKNNVSMDIVANVRFKSSLKVEIRQTNAAAQDIYGSVDYGLF
jgi:hypothetical protein